jgi:uncharacterized protein (UPF0212 family)
MDIELIQCPKCKEYFDANHLDLGTYSCPYCADTSKWKQQLKSAFKKLDEMRKAGQSIKPIVRSMRGDESH